ncbi:MAG: hypothetical protein U0869_02560 [Chloroflexota bacterium]
MRTRRLLMATIPLVLALGGAPTAMAQDAASTDCSLLTAQEVETALGASDLTVTGTGSFCVFSGDQTLYVAIQPGVDLSGQREQLSDEVETEIGGLPALTTEASSGVVVELPGSIMAINYSGSKTWAEVLPVLKSLAELAIPRVPAGPSAEDTDRLKALLPTSINDGPVTLQTFSGDLLMGFMDPESPAVVALDEALAAQGKTAKDILLVGVQTDATDDDSSVVAIWVDGADMSTLLEPFFRAFSDTGSDIAFSPIEVAGRPAVRIDRAEQTTIVVMVSGDTALAATVPEAELESVFAPFK